MKQEIIKMSNAVTLVNRGSREISCPGNILKYLLLNQTYKKEDKNTENSYEITKTVNDLPFISSITNKISPQGLIHARLSFLQY